MAKRKWQGVTRQQVENADEIIKWLKVADGTPLEVGVMQEIRDRLKVNARSGAMVRVRIKNLGHRPRHAVPVVTSMDALRQRAPVLEGQNRTWLESDLDQLRQLYTVQNLPIAEIAGMMDRSQDSIEKKAARMEIRRRPDAAKNYPKNRNRCLMASVRSVQERRRREYSERREA